MAEPDTADDIIQAHIVREAGKCGAVDDAIEHVAGGGNVLDPDIVAHFLSRQVTRSRLVDLTERERDVLALMAEGRSNRAIARQLTVSEKTVETHSASIFSKFDLLPEPDDHR